MRFLFAFFVALTYSSAAVAQGWNITQDLGQQENVYAICNLPDNHFLVAGSAWTVYPEYKKTFVSKIDPNGAVLWTELYDVGPDVSSYQEMRIVPVNDYENFLIYGETYGAIGNGSYSDIYCLKINAAGALLWQKQLGDFTTNQIRGLEPMGGGAVSLCTRMQEGYFRYQLDAEGNVERASLLPFDPAVHVVVDIKLEAEGNLLILTKKQISATDYNLGLLKVTAEGALLWEKEYGGALWDIALKLVPGENGHYFLVGSTNSYTPCGLLIIKVDATGEELWHKTFYSPTGATQYYPPPLSLTRLSDGGFALTATHQLSICGPSDAQAMRFDPEFNLLWSETIGGTDDYERFYAIVETTDHDILCAGGFYANNNDLLLTRFDENVTTAESQPAVQPAALGLSPNPAGALLTVRHDGIDRVKIFTAEGRLVQSQAVEPADRPVQIDTGGLKPGFYTIVGYAGAQAMALGKFVKN